MGASVLSFVFVSLAPGDFFAEMRLNPEISADTVRALRAQNELNRPLPVRYLHWIGSISKGDWGFSFAYNSPAAPILWSRTRNTLLLTCTATAFAWLVAMPLGIWAAARPGNWTDLFAGGVVAVLLATPELVLALLLLLFAVRTGYLPAGGFASVGTLPSGMWANAAWHHAADVSKHLFLPGVCLAAGLLPLLLSHVRTAMAEILQSPFIAAARGFGIPFRRLLWRHALPAAANPLISLFGFSIGMLVSSSLLVEAVFSWPGLGQLMLEAIRQRDFFLMVDAAILATAFLILGNFIADVLLYLSDPRIRVE